MHRPGPVGHKTGRRCEPMPQLPCTRQADHVPTSHSGKQRAWPSHRPARLHWYAPSAFDPSLQGTTHSASDQARPAHIFGDHAEDAYFTEGGASQGLKTTSSNSVCTPVTSIPTEPKFETSDEPGASPGRAPRAWSIKPALAAACSSCSTASGMIVITATVNLSLVS